MADFDRDTCSLTLRRVSLRTSDALYRAKTVTGKPIYLLVDEIVAFYFERHPHLLKTSGEMLEAIQADLQNMAKEFWRLTEEVRPKTDAP